MTEAGAAPAITFGELQQLTEPTAHYACLRAQAAENILRSGLVEEAQESVYEDVHLTDPEAERKGTLGRMWWYIAEIARRFEIPSTEVLGDASDLDAFQAQSDDRPLLPVASPNGPELRIEDDYHGFLAIAALRVVDSMSPRVGALWDGIEDRPTLGRTLADLAHVTGYIATRHGIRLSTVARQTMDEITEQSQQSGVEQVPERIITSVRKRSGVAPWIVTLCAQASIEHGQDAPKPYDVIVDLQ